MKESLTSKCQEVLCRSMHHHNEWMSMGTLDKIQEKKNKMTAINNNQTQLDKVKAQADYTEAKKQAK